MDEKARLREEMRRRRAAVPAGELARLGEAARRALESRPEWRAARVVYPYADTGGEVPTGPLDAAAREAGKTVCYPRVEGAELRFHVSARGELNPGFASIPEPPPSAPPAPAPQLVLVPCLAVDAEGHRLGQGGGHYDRFLHGLRRGVTTVALVHLFQVVPRVPRTPRDHPVGLWWDGVRWGGSGSSTLG